MLALFERAGVDDTDLRSQLTCALERVGGAAALSLLLADGTSRLGPVATRTLESFKALGCREVGIAWARRLDRLRSAHGIAGGPGPVRGGVVVAGDATYPPNLARAIERPPFLFHRGALGTLGDRLVAVVGTRRPSPDGVALARQLTTDLSTRGAVIVSGLALGIDAVAHRACIEAGGITVGVLGHGISSPLYPRCHEELASAIIGSGGVLISQFWPEQAPDHRSFLSRNVTMAGISLATVVVEAGERSGARQQARKSLELERPVFLPRRLLDAQTWAKEFASRTGVEVVERPDQILSSIGASITARPQVPVQLAFA